MRKVLLQRLSLALRRKPLAAIGVRDAGDAARLARRYIGDADREVVLAILLDQKHHVNGVHVVGVGGIASCPVTPRQVFAAALLSAAPAVILAHNHPSGDPTPSVDDVRLTRRLVEAGDILGIQVLDHVILGERDAFSFPRHDARAQADMDGGLTGGGVRRPRLTARQRRVLSALAGGPATSAEVARRAGLGRRTAVLLLLVLWEAGLVETSPSRLAPGRGTEVGAVVPVGSRAARVAESDAPGGDGCKGSAGHQDLTG